MSEPKVTAESLREQLPKGETIETIVSRLDVMLIEAAKAGQKTVTLKIHQHTPTHVIQAVIDAYGRNQIVVSSYEGSAFQGDLGLFLRARWA